MGDVWFIQGRYVRAGAPLWSLGSLWVVEIVRGRPWCCCWVHSGRWFSSGATLGSFRVVRVQPGSCCVDLGWLESFNFSLEVGGFFRGRWIHSGALWGSLGSFGEQWVSLGSFRVVRVSNGGRWVRLGAPWGAFGLIRGRVVRSAAPWVQLGSFWVVGFVRVQPGDRLVHSG